MQLIHDTEPLAMTIQDLKMHINTPVKDALSDRLELQDKKSNAALLLMNPVASGDNVATGLSSIHKLKLELPPLVPCCEGRELQINEDLVRSGLSAISVKHDNLIQCWSMPRPCENLQVAPGVVKHRNSFRCLHRPDLKRVTYLRRMTPDELESLFNGYADLTTPAKKYDTQMAPENSIPKDLYSESSAQENGNDGVILRAIPETRSRSEDVPAGMRLHGARARLYTSVLATTTRGGDQLGGIKSNEEYDPHVPEDNIAEDEVPLNEELQIILPPRCDDDIADSSVTTTSTNS